VQSGAADAGNVAYGAYPEYFPAFGFDYSFLFGPSDPEIVVKAMDGVLKEFPQFDEDFAAQNLKHLFLLPWDNYDLGSVDPIETVDDLKGKRVGCWGIWAPKWVEAAGASGVATPAPDRYTQLMTGVLDVSLLPVDVHMSLKLYEVAKHWTISNIGAFVPEPNNMNLDTWNDLPADIQKIMMDTGEEVAIEHTAILKGSRQDAFAEMEKAGVIIHTMSDEERAKWAEQYPDVPGEWAAEVAAKGYPAYEMVQRYQELCAEYGHVWLREWAVQ
jgi:TRAP-type C4-dicarboxylate transport system substrate-binding protein